MLELLSTDEEDSTELDDATELLLFAEELLATEDELFSLEELTTDEEDSTELEEVTELLDPSTPALPPLRACPEPVEGMTLEEELLTTDEEDATELEETAELELLATEEELFSLEELTTDEEDSTELEEVTELLDPSTSLGMTLEEELRMTLEEDSSAGFSSPDELFAEVLSSQAARPNASANAQVPRARNFFFMSNLNPAFSRIIL